MSGSRSIGRSAAVLRLVVIVAMLVTSVSTAGAATVSGTVNGGDASARSAPLRRADRAKAAKADEYKPSEVIVRYKPGASASVTRAADKKAGAASVAKLGKNVPGLAKVKLKKGVSVEEAIAAYEAQPGVLYAEPNYQGGIDVVPDDSRFGDLWGLDNTGQEGGVPDADIDAPEAWDTTTGSRDVVVAVIDTGVDYTHPDLADNIWINPGEIADNGIDDDRNGYVDDVYGIDTYNDDADPFDDHSHGTHCAGTIGAVGDDGIGVAGVNWNVSLMAVKWIGADGMGWTDDAIEAIEYAYANGADLSSNSWHVFEYSQAMYDTIAALDKPIVFASGNESSNTDVWINHPSAYDLPNILAIGASNRYDQPADFSNYGPKSVDLFAPGEDILSTVPGETYDVYSGTSMATPHVAGVAALLLSAAPDAEWEALKLAIMGSADATTTFEGRCLSGARLNAANALEVIGADPASLSGTVTSVEGVPLEGISVSVDGTLDATTGPGGEYLIDGIVPGAHAVVFSHPDYLTKIVSGERFEPGVAHTLDAELVLAGKIAGTVTAEDGGAPLEGIQVTAYLQTEEYFEPVSYTFTGPDGTYFVGGLSTGTYFVEFADGALTYVTEYYDDQPALEEADPVDVTEGLTTEPIDAALQEYGHISGTVTSAVDGSPLEGIWVTAFIDADGWWEPVWGATTGPDGTYDMSGLVEGAYRVEFYDGAGTYAAQYYDGATRIDRGDDVSVRLGETTAGIDAALKLAGHITGTVTAADGGAPLQGIWITAYRNDGGTWEPVAGAESMEDGTYDLGGLTTGPYRIEFYDYTGVYGAEYFRDKATLKTAIVVAVRTGKTRPGIDAALDYAGSISGTVLAADTGDPVSGVFVDTWKQVGKSWEPVMGTETMPDGTYSVAGLSPGTYRVSFYEFSGQYLPEYYDDAMTLETATDITIGVASEVTGIDATLDPAGQIAGTLTGSAGELIEYGWVLAYAYQGGEWMIVAGTETGSDGTYLLGGLSTGSYRVEFVDPSGVHAFEFYDDAHGIDAATDVPVTAGEVTEGIDAQLGISGLIMGTVTDESGAPIPYCMVQAYRQNGRTWEPVPTWGADTRDDGTYVLGGLSTGTYRIEFYNEWNGYAVEYYDNAKTVRKATDVPVTAGEVIEGIDASLRWVGIPQEMQQKTPAARASMERLAELVKPDRAAPDTATRAWALTIHGTVALPGSWPAAWVAAQ